MVVDVRGVGDQQQRPPALDGPVGQLVGVGVLAVEEAALLGRRGPDRVLAAPPPEEVPERAPRRRRVRGSRSRARMCSRSSSLGQVPGDRSQRPPVASRSSHPDLEHRAADRPSRVAPSSAIRGRRTPVHPGTCPLAERAGASPPEADAGCPYSYNRLDRQVSAWPTRGNRESELGQQRLSDARGRRGGSCSSAPLLVVDHELDRDPPRRRASARGGGPAGRRPTMVARVALSHGLFALSLGAGISG